jgi:hypothetical protein
VGMAVGGAVVVAGRLSYEHYNQQMLGLGMV